MGLSSVSTTIATGTALSPTLKLEGGIPAGIQMPAAWTAANLTFQGSNDDITYFNIYDDNNVELVVTAAASRFIVFRDAIAAQFYGIRYLKIRSGTSGTPVNQLADRTLYVPLRFD